MRKVNLADQNHAQTSLPYVESVLNYLAPIAEKPFTYVQQPPAGKPRRNWQFDPRTVRIYNGRPIADALSLDREGCALKRAETAVRNFYDDAEVRSVYYAEIERLAREATGAVKALVFDHNVRSGSPARRDELGIRPPVRYVHNDYTINSAPQRVRDLLPAHEASLRLRKRFAEINLWRPIRGTVQEAPLAVCDAASIAPEDFVAMDLIYPDRTGEVYAVRYNPAHRWLYFPAMEPSEVLLLKCYDSAEDGRTRFTAHSAFDDPSSPANAEPRESIETRVMVFWD